MSVLVSRQPWVVALLDKLESGSVSSAEIDAPTRQRLTATKDKALRARVDKLFAAGTTEDRKQVLADFRAAPTTSGDLSRGAALFQKKCANCHKLAASGMKSARIWRRCRTSRRKDGKPQNILRSKVEELLSHRIWQI